MSNNTKSVKSEVLAEVLQFPAQVDTKQDLVQRFREEREDAVVVARQAVNLLLDFLSRYDNA